jgi:hypothetical protein
VAWRLKDLVDAGYGIGGYNDNTYTASIFSILKRENISHSSVNEPPFVPNTVLVDSDAALRLLTSCNVTHIMPPGLDDIIQDWINQHPSLLGIQCYVVKETRQTVDRQITYSGYFATSVHTFLRSFQESGILNMFYKFREYINFLSVRSRVENKRYASERAEVPFELKDPKILSIFITWGILLIGASLVFLVEFQYNHVYYYLYT